MSDMPEPKGWTIPQGLLAGVLVLLGTAITAIAFLVMWQTVTDVVRQYMHSRAWTVPVAGEIAFLFFYLLGVLLAWRKAPPVAARSLLMAGLIAGSVQLNVYAARGVLVDAVAHLLVTWSFFGVLITGKAAITALRGGKVRADRIGVAEWLTHPARSAALAWWMQAWGEPSRQVALDRYMRLLFTIAVAQSDSRVGRTPVLWRHKLPRRFRFQLSAGLLPDSVLTGEGDWQEAVTEHVRGELKLLDKAPAQGTPEVTSEVTSGGTTEGTAEGSPQGTADGSAGGTPQGIRKGTTEGSQWPESRTVDRALLVRRTRAAMRRWEDKHPEQATAGKRLPATQLGAALKLRMSRDTATALLAEAAADGKPHLVPPPMSQTAAVSLPGVRL